MIERDERYRELFENDDGDRSELDPTDPRHPDFDLSDAAPYAPETPRRGFVPLRRGIVLLVTIVVLFSLFWPLCARIF